MLFVIRDSCGFCFNTEQPFLLRIHFVCQNLITVSPPLLPLDLDKPVAPYMLGYRMTPQIMPSSLSPEL